MGNLNNDPVRVLLSQTEKKGLFSKKEVSSYAVGDENGAPLTAYEFSLISPYEDGFTYAVKKKGGPVLLDLAGKEVLPSYSGAFSIRPKNGYLTIFRSSSKFSGDAVMLDTWPDPAGEKIVPAIPYLNRGLAAQDQKILIDPKKNSYLQIIDDIVLYGDWSPVGLDYCRLGAAKLSGDSLETLLPCEYNYVQYLWDRVIAVGRYVVTKTSTPSSLTRNTVTTTAQPAFRLYHADSGWIGDRIYGEIHRTKHGNISAVIYPHIRPEDLTHRQTMGEAFSGAGLLNFKDPKKVVLNDRFEFPQ